MTTGAFSPEYARGKTWKVDEGLWNAVLATIPRGSSVLDIGAGIGRYVSLLNQNGYKASGVDGIKDIEQISNGVVKHCDLTTDSTIGETADWALFIEVGEHVPWMYDERVISTISNAASKGLIVSWARINQRGAGHINCHMPEWVAVQFAAMTPAWSLDEEATLKARKIAGKGWDRKLLVFT